MIEIEQIAERAYRMAVIAEFRQADAEELVAFARETLDSAPGRNLLIDLTAVCGFSWSAVGIELAHIPTLVKFIYALDRIAIISDEAWIRTGSRLESAILPGVVYEVYDEDEADAARAWVLNQSDAPHRGAFRELDIDKPGIAAFELSGRLDREESERGVALVRDRFEAGGYKRLLLVIRRWHGFDLDRLLSREVLAGKLEIARGMERYAIVGGPRWVGKYAELTSVFFDGDIKAFPLEELDEAIAWLEG